MVDSVEIDIRGLADVHRALYRFGDQLGNRVTLLALRSGANYLLKKVRAVTPVSTKPTKNFKSGRLRRAITVKTSKLNRPNRNGKIGVFLSINPGKKRDDPKGAWYGKFVEHGYNTGSARVSHEQAGIAHNSRLRRRKDRRFRVATRRYNFTGRDIPGKHMIENTFNANKDYTLRLILTAIEQGGRTLINEIQRR